METVRVLQVITSLNCGGMESMIMNYYRNFDRTKVQFDFLLFAGRSYYDDEVESLGGRIFRLTPRRKNPLKNALEVRRFFRSHPEYPIVHIHQGVTDLLPLKTAARNHIPVRIAHTHSIDRKYREKLRLYNEVYAKPTISRLATHYFCCSPTVAGDIFVDEIVQNQKYEYIRNAIDLEKFRFCPQTREKLRAELGLGNLFTIGNAGRFTSQKNQAFLVDILAELKKREPEAVLLLAGGGELLEQVRQKAAAMGLADSVRFLGIRDDMDAVYQALDVYVMPSLFEGLPVAGVEAQAAGLKCFFSDRVPPETGITANAEFIALDQPAAFWAGRILACRGYDRTDVGGQIVKAGFDIKTQAKELEAFYLNSIGKEVSQ